MKVFIEGGVISGLIWVYAEHHNIINNILETSFKSGREWNKMGYSMFCVSTKILREFMDTLLIMDIEAETVEDDKLISAHHFRMHCENILRGEYEPVS